MLSGLRPPGMDGRTVIKRSNLCGPAVRSTHPPTIHPDPPATGKGCGTLARIGSAVGGGSGRAKALPHEKLAS
eukprot:2418881-Prymnesium_polylepis.1